MATLSNTSSVPQTASRDMFLRYVLRGNVTFSVLSGIVFLIMANPLAEAFGITGYAWELRLLGTAMFPFAAYVLWVSNQETMVRWQVWSVIEADTLWVVGTAVILLTNVFGFSSTGNWTFLIIADMVATFAILQFIGLRHLR